MFRMSHKFKVNAQSINLKEKIQDLVAFCQATGVIRLFTPGSWGHLWVMGLISALQTLRPLLHFLTADKVRNQNNFVYCNSLGTFPVAHHLTY